MRKTKPKKEYGYYCDLCGNRICKYEKDFYSCGGLSVEVVVKIETRGNKIRDLVGKDICHDCAKLIAEEVVSEF